MLLWGALQTLVLRTVDCIAIGRPIFIQRRYWEELRSLYEGAEPQPSTG